MHSQRTFSATGRCLSGATVGHDGGSPGAVVLGSSTRLGIVQEREIGVGQIAKLVVVAAHGLCGSSSVEQVEASRAVGGGAFP